MSALMRAGAAARVLAEHGVDGWTPSEISTSLWVDAADAATITADMGAVSEWNDKSGNDWHVTQAAAADRPALVDPGLNGLPVLRFDGVTDRLSTSLAGSIFRNRTYGWLCCVVNRTNDADTTEAVFAVSRGTTNNGVRFGFYTGVSGAQNRPVIGGRRLDGDSFGSHTATPALSNEWSIIFAALDWANRTAIVYIDGELDGQTSDLWSGGGATSDTDSLGPLGIGAAFTASGNGPEAFADMDVAELVVGSASLAAADIDRLFGYLAWKWGLEANLPVGHPYKDEPPRNDPHWDSVALLMAFETEDGSTSIVDESRDGRTVTPFGDAQVDTEQKNYGDGSLLLDGTGDYLTVPEDGSFEGNQVFTAEAFIRIPSLPNARNTIFGKRQLSGPVRGWIFWIEDDNTLRVLGWPSDPTPSVDFKGATVLSVDTWAHVAVTRNASGLWSVWLDGALEASGTEAAPPNPSNASLYIGRDPDHGSRYFAGWIDEVRFTPGHVRYTEPFTPPSAPFPRS